MSVAGGEIRGDTAGEDTAAPGRFSFSPEPTLEDIRRLHAEFAAERDWEQFHQPRNLLLALVGEVGELAELLLFAVVGDAERTHGSLPSRGTQPPGRQRCEV
ncbi:dCTP pyrophosphatase 1 isoform X2 [Macaca fascicularis]|uniref:dCTP pyrophosphatase 1 isoform X2 n=1 Tax=Macaca fascicularis TaxID=9541 RepID=UPI003D15BFF5